MDAAHPGLLAAQTHRTPQIQTCSSPTESPSLAQPAHPGTPPSTTLQAGGGPSPPGQAPYEDIPGPAGRQCMPPPRPPNSSKHVSAGLTGAGRIHWTPPKPLFGACHARHTPELKAGLEDTHSGPTKVSVTQLPQQLALHGCTLAKVLPDCPRDRAVSGETEVQAASHTAEDKSKRHNIQGQD